ncbi:zinc finger protein 644 isoform 2-T2 [Spinachia spinachia]
MSDLRRNAREDKDVERLSDSPSRTQEPLQSHTFSPKNNAAGLSSDEHENPLNGTQPNPFVYSGAPAVPHAGNSLPSGALVNGPGSHPTSEVHCVLNKGTVLSNNVLDAAWQAGTDTSPEVLPPPSELQSDAWKNTAGPVLKTLATQPGVNTPLSHSEENESKLACPAPSGAGGAEQMHISQPLTKQPTKTGSRRDVERSESSSDDHTDAEAVGGDSASERFLHNDRRLETRVMHRGDRKHNTHAKSMSASLEKVKSSLNHTHGHACFCSDDGNVDVANHEDAVGARSDIEDSAVPLQDLSRNTVSDSRLCIYSTAAHLHCNEQNDPEDEDNCTSEEERLRTEKVQRDPLFFSCTTCNVNFKERRHFHRHMMYHLSKHNQVNSENVSHPFICRECGRLFCDSGSLTRHIIIHRDRLEKTLGGIKDLKNTALEDGGATARCPRCAPGCDCPKIYVQHAKTRDNLKHYYFCEECNYITLTQQALEAHSDTHRFQHRELALANEAEEAGRVRYRRIDDAANCQKVADQPDPNLHRSTLRERPHFSHRSTCKNGDFYIETSNDTAVNEARFDGCAENTPPPSVWRVDRHGKLLLQTAAQSDAAKDPTCVEEHNDCEAFGSSKQATCPAPAEFLPSAGSPKLVLKLRQGGKNDPASRRLQAQANPNDLSMGKRSTHLQSTIGNVNGGASARFRLRLNKLPANKEVEKGRKGSSDDTRNAAGSFLESGNARNPYARRYFPKRHRFSAKDQSPRVLKAEEEGGEDCSDIEQLIIKEEFVDTRAGDDSPESPRMFAGGGSDVFPKPALEHKRCPYCPASFESGVGLSNHVRGHLHRVGLSYNARHMVSPEQVALRDRQPRIRRRIPGGTRRMIKGVKPETQAEQKCPLCRGRFDTKTGLTNHVRGHLKRIGTSVASTGKSPLSMLKELLWDKKEHQNSLQALDKRKSASRTSSSGLILMHMSVPVEIQFDMRSPRPVLNGFGAKQEPEAFSERRLQVEAQRGPEASSSTLVELLRVRQPSMALSARSNQEDFKPRDLCDYTKDYTQAPNWAHEPCDSSEICIQCNGAGAGLPCPLRAFAHRKRIASFEGHGWDYKPKKPRPGLKTAMPPCLVAENYTFTCRFCDLVFQGPLSVQEDWIKHLQRHLLHTGVPHSGTGMVEVLGLHRGIHMSICRERADPD